jgi:hypothetical protein
MPWGGARGGGREDCLEGKDDEPPLTHGVAGGAAQWGFSRWCSFSPRPRTCALPRCSGTLVTALLVTVGALFVGAIVAILLKEAGWATVAGLGFRGAVLGAVFAAHYFGRRLGVFCPSMCVPPLSLFALIFVRFFVWVGIELVYPTNSTKHVTGSHLDFGFP